MKTAIQILMAALGSLGFGILLGMKPKHLLWATLGGGLTWACYLVCEAAGADVFLANLIAAFAANIWAGILAHRRKAPAVIFTITAVVPLIPGSGLYGTMSALVNRDQGAALLYGTNTMLTAAAIGFGALLYTVLTRMTQRKE